MESGIRNVFRGKYLLKFLFKPVWGKSVIMGKLRGFSAFKFTELRQKCVGSILELRILERLVIKRGCLKDEITIVRPKKSSHCQLETFFVNRKTLRVSNDQSIKTEYPRFRVLLFCYKKREALLLGSSQFAGPVFRALEKQYALKKWQHENKHMFDQPMHKHHSVRSILSTLSYFAFLSFAFNDWPCFSNCTHVYACVSSSVTNL